MIVKYKQLNGKHRVVDATTEDVAVNRAGAPIDGGGHDSHAACVVQVNAFNAATETKTVKISACSQFMPPEQQVKVKEVIPDPEAEIIRVPTTAKGPPLCKAEGEERVVSMYLSTRDLDRDGEIVMPDGCDLTLWKMNPVIQWAHNLREPPIGKGLDIKSDGYGLLLKFQFAPTPFAMELYELVKGGYLRTMSAGIADPKFVHRQDDEFTTLMDKFYREWPEFTQENRDSTHRVIKSWSLLEATLCSVPCNPFAMATAVKSGVLKKGMDGGPIDTLHHKWCETPPAPPQVAIREVVSIKQVPMSPITVVRAAISGIRGGL